MAKPGASDRPLDAIAQQLDKLSHAELLEVQAILVVLLAAKRELGSTGEGEAEEPEVHQGLKGGRLSPEASDSFRFC